MADTYEKVTKYGAILLSVMIVFAMLVQIGQSRVASSSAVIFALIAMLVIVLVK